MKTDKFQVRQAWRQKPMSNIAPGVPITLGQQCHVRLFFLALYLTSKTWRIFMVCICVENHIFCKKNKITCHKWSLVCRNWAIDYRYKVRRLLEAKHGFKKLCQTWHRVVPTLMLWHRFWRHVWRQKAVVFPCCNHLLNLGIWGFKCGWITASPPILVNIH